MDNYIRKSYFGGTTEVYRPKGENIFHYDINSFYPFVMHHYDMPIGMPKWSKNINLDNDFGFFRCKIKVTNLEIPILEYRKDGNLICPIGEWEGIYFSEELKYAKSIGYEIEILDGFIFKKQRIFTNYINDYFNKKYHAEKKTYQYYFYKLLLNSIYGRFGIKKNKFFTFIENEAQHLYTSRSEEVKHFEFLNDNYILVNSTKSSRANFYRSYVQIASSITSYARIHLHKYKIKYKNNIYYSDTDSLYLDCKMDESDVDNSALGYFKLVNFYKTAIFIKSKTYYLRAENGEEIIRMPGLNSKDINLLSIKDYETLLLQDTNIILKDIERNRKVGFFESKLLISDFTFYSYNPRRQRLYNEHSKYIKTLPIKI